MADHPPINVPEARKVLRRLDAALDSAGFTAPEQIGALKHRIAVYVDEFAGHCGLVPADFVGKAKG